MPQPDSTVHWQLLTFLQQLPQLFPDHEAAWLGTTASVLSRSSTAAIAALINAHDDAKRAFVMAELEAAQALAGIKPLQPPQEKMVTIYVPPVFYDDDDYDAIRVSFKDEEDLRDYKRCNQVGGLLEVAEVPDDTIPLAITKFAKLVDGGVYTHAPCSKEALARMQEEARHLQQALADEFGYAVLHHAQQTEPDQDYVLREDLRKLPNAINEAQELDVVIVGKFAAWVGLHETHAKDARAVKRIAERAKELAKLPNQLPSCVKPAYMVERADPTAEQKLDAACRNLQVLRFKRSGQAIKPVNSMAVVGRQQLLRF